MMYNSHGMYSNWYFIVLILIIAAVFVAVDAEKKGYNGFLWAMVVIFMPMFGFIIYLIFSATTSGPRNSVYSPYAPATPVPVGVNRSVNQTGENGIYCTTCGSANHAAAKFCSACGSEIL